MKKTLFFLLFLLMINNLISQENRINQYTQENGLFSVKINDITQDKTGYLWLATNNGLIRFDGNEFVDFSNVTKSEIENIYFINNQLFTSTKTGLFYYKNNNFKFLGKEIVNALVSFNGYIYAGTSQGVSVVKEDYLQPIQLHSKIDFAVINDLIWYQNKLIVATNNGLWSINNIEKSTEISKINNFVCKSLTINNNKLLASTNKKILSIDEDFNTKIITINGIITGFRNIKEELYIATANNGVFIYSNNLTFKRAINKYNSKISNKISTIFEDKNSTIWIASSDKGLFKIKQESNNILHSKPELFIETIKVNHQIIEHFNSEKIILKPKENNISFYYKTVNLEHPKKVFYRYKLTSKYTPWTQKDNVEFANLHYGNYKFKVQSKIGNTISKEQTIAFKITTPFYKKTWFYVFSFVLLCTILYVITNKKIKKINKANTLRVKELETKNNLLALEHKALQLQMNPHFIFNVLNGIKSLGNTGKTLELNNTISQFSKLLRGVLNNSNLAEITLKDEIEMLTNYIELEQKMSSNSFDYKILKQLKNIEEEEILIPPMLIQPFVENAIQHGFNNNKNNKIIISFSINNNFLECSVIDNGIGFNQSKKKQKMLQHKPLALKVTKERIKSNFRNSTFSIEEIKKDKKVVGTKVWFKIPLKTDF